MKKIFITGGTGYIGSRLTEILLAKGYEVKALVRRGSESKLPQGCSAVIANPFDASSFRHFISEGDTFIQLLGVAHPGPKKKELFRKIDLESVLASAAAASNAGVAHFIYISVAQVPTKIMHDYQQCRAAGETAVLATGLPATFIRPWYVVGPGHYWPLFFQPLFKILELLPATAQKARALRLVYLSQVLRVLVFSVEHPPTGVRILEIEDIRRGR
jgi:uncharacterized protein YbjT (DUF2867 family)